MRQVLLAFTTIVAVAALGAVGTYASFVDSEVSEGNTVQAGSLELQLGDTHTFPGVYNWPYESDEEFSEDPLGDSIEATWNYLDGYPGGMQPGDTLESRAYLRNWGTVEATYLGIDCVSVNYDQFGNPVDDVPKDAVMVIEFLKYYNSSLVEIVKTDGGIQYFDSAYIDDDDGDGRITLRDWQLHGISNLEPPKLTENGSSLDMKVVFDPPANPAHQYYRLDEYASYKTNMTLIFNLR
ncbi:SipW-dependent-type signal peptide-containing protein [Chloroflexota bacterium]